MSQCSDPDICPGGGCTGCQNGEVWCQDPRCTPFCPGSECIAQVQTHDTNGNLVVLIILLGLFTLLFVVWYMYGPRLLEPHDDHNRANVVMPSH